MQTDLDNAMATVIKRLNRETQGACGEYIGLGLIQIKHTELARNLPVIKYAIQIMDHRLAITAISSPDTVGLCLINFDQVG